jgi:hypothetical protein
LQQKKIQGLKQKNRELTGTKMMTKPCFIDEFTQKRAIWYGLRKPMCIANEIGAENCACMLHK